MELHLTGLNFGYQNSGLISDLAKYKSVDKYLQAIINNDPEVSFHVLNCAFQYFPGQLREIIRNGNVTDDAQKHINFLKRKPGYVKNIVSENIVIKADAFLETLYFEWDY